MIRRVPLWLAAPAIAGLVLFLVYPTIYLIALTLTKSSLAHPLRSFTGTDNIVTAFASPAFAPSLWKSSLFAVVVAIAIPEIPRVVRLVRSIVLTIREEPYVEAAVTAGTPLVPLLWRHVLPNCIAPLIVQATFVCASAIVVEAILSFLGVGIPPEVPSWGNVMAAGRQYFRLFPGQILFPGFFLAVTVLCVNVLGDALRDRLDPKLRRRV